MSARRAVASSIAPRGTRRKCSPSARSKPSCSIRWPSISALSWPPISHSYRPCSASSRARRRALRLAERAAGGAPDLLVGVDFAILTQRPHEVGHFDRHLGCVAALFIDACACLFLVVGGENRVGHRHAVLERHPRNAARGLVGDDLEVIGLAAD